MEGLTEADGARAQALGVLAALISAVLNSRLRFCGMNVLMTRERRRPDAFGRRGIYDNGRVVRRPFGDCLPPARTEILDGGGDCPCHHQAALRCSELKLLFPVYDRSGFQQHCRHERTVQHQQVIVTVNAGFLID